MLLCSLVVNPEIITSNTLSKQNSLVSGGDTLPVNLSVIPSGQKWVFDTIYKTAFPHLYTCEVCSTNRLVLMDEDKSEYEPFECAIVTTNHFKNLKVMLCTFHAIWMAFKTDLYTLLDGIEHGGVLSEKCIIIVRFIHP
jgi:hypothetical protein